MSGQTISTAAELATLPAECLLRSTQPGFGPTHVVTFDCGDGEVMYGVVRDIGSWTAAEIIEEHGPLELLHRPDVDVSEFDEAAGDLVWLSEWIDAGNADRAPEAVSWGRLAKITEEAGEVIAAFIGMTGQNPRKGITHTVQDVVDELLDVAVTALGAYEHLQGHQGTSLDALVLKIAMVAARARATVGATDA
jgi:hypothetical protein